MQYENERMEYKSQLTEDIYKEVIAFTNTDGGVIYIGIDDQGNVTGIDNVDETYTRLTNGIRDAIQPDVTMFVRYVLQENKVIRIEVGEGSYKPYYLKGKGLKPAGVYVRQGATSVQASPEQIRQMIKDSDGDVFEEMRTVQQDLTFDEAAAAFKWYKVDFSEDKYIELGLRNIHDDQYTNLALLLSDQCQHTTKIAVLTMNPAQSSGTARSLAARSSSSLKTRSTIWRCATGQSLPSRASSARINRTIPRKPSAKRCSMRWCIGTTASAAVLSST